MARRILLDITTLARASGHADGIVRTLRELARFAAVHLPDIAFVLYDLDVNAPRFLKPSAARLLIDGSAKIDLSYFADPFSPNKRFRERLPAPLKRVFLWIQRPRRQAYLALERLRIKGGRAARFAERVQPLLLNEKYTRELAMPGGGIKRLLPHDAVWGDPLVLSGDDIIILAGSDWLAMYRQLAESSAAGRPRTVVLCYDIIPLLFPQFFLQQTRDAFRSCFHEVFPHADLIIFTAKRIMADAHAYCTERGMKLGDTDIVYLGANVEPVQQAPVAELPAGLTAGRYALFVSTLEPRKGHRLLLNVWRRLLAEGIPQKFDFKLVFVGRKGWLVDDLIDDLAAHTRSDPSLILLSNADDATLHQLYRQAAFCLYPSRYEGFGLPVIEAFRYGKAVIASNAGALLETVGGFSPCLDPLDENAWYDKMKLWIENPDARKTFESAIRNDFRGRDWQDVAKDFYRLIDSKFGKDV